MSVCNLKKMKTTIILHSRWHYIIWQYLEHKKVIEFLNSELRINALRILKMYDCMFIQ